MTIDWISAGVGEYGGGLPYPTENAMLRGTGVAWAEAAAIQARTDGVDIGSDDDDQHNLQGSSLFFGADNDIHLQVSGHANIDRLDIGDFIRIAGGQYPAYYGYGWSGNQYPGAPYWGSYPADAVGPEHGTGTTIDRRGIRSDAVALLERGFACYDVVQNQYVTVYYDIQADGSVVLATSLSDYEPNAH